MSLQKDLANAGRKARKRDLENERIISNEELQQMNEIQAKANARGMVVVPERKVKNRSRFIQIMPDNWGFLEDHNYMSGEEKLFLLSLLRYIALGSNAIVDSPKKKQPVAINQTQIAKILGTSKTKVSRVINSLVQKGVLSRSESGVEGNNAKSYVLYVNPHIIYCGDRDKVNETLVIMFSKAMKMPILNKLPERFF